MFGGLDIGSLTCDAVIFDGGRILSSVVIPTGSFPRSTAETALQNAATAAKIRVIDLLSTVSTGYGRKLPSGTRAITEITCFARGAWFLSPGAQMVIDVGGQDSKVILLDGEGRVSEFLTNERCAAGTGRFLETMARALGMQVDEMSTIGHDAEPAQISSTCGVFAESEVVGLLAAETPVEKIVAGINKSIVDRTLALVHRLGIRERIMFCGGVSRNAGVRLALEKALGKPVIVPDEPQIVGALGAAIIAAEDYRKLQST